MKITKDFLKFKKFLRSEKLKPVQKVIMEYLFELHNCKFGYAFPSMKDLVLEVNGACNNTVISAIKKLEKLGLLKVNRNHKNNRYYIKNIEEFLNRLDAKTTESEDNSYNKYQSFENENVNLIDDFKDSLTQGENLPFFNEDTNIANEENYHYNIEESLDETILENKIAREMKCSLEEAVNALKYAKEKHAKNLIAYAKSSIKNGWHKIQNNYNSVLSNFKNNNTFDNFTQRVYDYEKLERELLGWDL